MNRFVYISSFIIALAVAGCTVVSYQKQAVAPKSQLQTREFQTREFDTNNTKLILKAMINVLQDDGFVIKNADSELGLLFATKEMNISKTGTGSNQDFWNQVFENMSKKPQQQKEQTYNKIKVVEASINVSEIGRRSKVRANFQAKILDNLGNAVDVYPVEDQKYYQDFFSKVDKGIFLQKQGF
ncbi:MAG: hypothetical protein V1779_02815 [bacterium]